MSNPWGLPDSKAGSQESPAPSQDDQLETVDPQVQQTGGAIKGGHQTMVRVHVLAILIWLVVAGVIGGLWLTGRDVPAVLAPAGMIAAAGHALFLAAHLYLASVVRPGRQRPKIASTVSPTGGTVSREGR